MLVNLILWIILGGVAGWVASLIMKKNAQMGMVANIVVGIVGALVGGLIMQLLGIDIQQGFNLPSLLVAIAGAVVVLFLLNLVRQRT